MMLFLKRQKKQTTITATLTSFQKRIILIRYFMCIAYGRVPAVKPRGVSSSHCAGNISIFISLIFE